MTVLIDSLALRLRVSRTPEGDDHYYEVEWPVDDRGDAIPFAEEH